MARYFFNIHDGVDIRDELGTELPDLEAVRLKAVRAAGEAIRDLGAVFWDSTVWRMQVVDDAHLHVLTLYFSARLSERPAASTLGVAS